MYIIIKVILYLYSTVFFNVCLPLFVANRIDEEAFNSLNKKLIKDLIVAVRDRIRFSKLHELYLQESCPVKAEIFFQNVPEDTLFKTENDDDSVQSDQDNSTSILDSQNDEMMNYPDTSSSHTGMKRNIFKSCKV